MYYCVKDENDKVLLFNPVKSIVETDLSFHPDWEPYGIQETEDFYVLDPEFGYVLMNEEYYARETQRRQTFFESQFLATSLGNYRLQPKGYANAQQSIDTVNALVLYSQGLTAEIASQVIFYDTPDFTKPEQCTEAWLIQHQHHPNPMTLQEWGTFYVEFSRAYALKQYKDQMEAQNN